MTMLKKTSITNRIIWICLAFFGWYILLGEIFMLPFGALIDRAFKNPSDGLVFVNS